MGNRRISSSGLYKPVT